MQRRRGGAGPPRSRSRLRSDHAGPRGGGIRPTARAAAPPRPLAVAPWELPRSHGAHPAAARSVPPYSAAGSARSAGRGGRCAGQGGEVFRALRSQLRVYPAGQSRGRPPEPLPSHGTPQTSHIPPKPPPSRRREGIPRDAGGSPGDGKRSMSTFSVLMMVRVGFRSTAAFMVEAGARGPGLGTGGRLLRRGSGGRAPSSSSSSSSSFLPRSLPSPSALLRCRSAPPRPPPPPPPGRAEPRGGRWGGSDSGGEGPDCPRPGGGPGPGAAGSGAGAASGGSKLRLAAPLVPFPRGEEDLEVLFSPCSIP